MNSTDHKRINSSMRFRKELVKGRSEFVKGDYQNSIEYAMCSLCRKEIGIILPDNSTELFDKFRAHVCEPKAIETLLLIDSILSEDEAIETNSLEEKINRIWVLIDAYYEARDND